MSQTPHKRCSLAELAVETRDHRGVLRQGQARAGSADMAPSTSPVMARSATPNGDLLRPAPTPSGMLPIAAFAHGSR
jgi:hypothetical protein